MYNSAYGYTVMPKRIIIMNKSVSICNNRSAGVNNSLLYQQQGCVSTFYS
jgi:hypothetical protein